MRIIIRDVKPDDLILTVRAAKWLLARPSQKDAILIYGDGFERMFYVRRNKSSITVRKAN